MPAVSGTWSDADTERLVDLRKDGIAYEKIARDYMPERSTSALRNQYYRIVKEKRKGNKTRS